MSKNLDDIAGLPEELGIGGDLERAEQRVSISVDSQRYGKAMTVVSGFDDSTDLDSVASTLKSRLAVGGTVSDGRVELQGDHSSRLPELLREEGYRVVS